MAGPARSGPAGSWFVRRYPRWWRDRYADELLALLEDRPAGWRDRLDLARGALDAHLRGSGGRSPVLLAAALVAGGAWTVTGTATLLAPTPADWPGYTLDVLPLVTVAALTTTMAVLGLARRAWPATTGALELLLVLVAVAGLLWTLALLVATVGGPYGPVTAATQAVAAVAAAALGLVVLRVGASTEGVAIVVTGVALLIPTPTVWIALGAGWTAIGIWAGIPRADATPPVGHA